MVGLPDNPSTLVEAVDRAASLWGDRIAFTFPEASQAFTFAEVKDNVDRLAQQFGLLGVGVGDPVALMMGNEPAYPLLWLALGKIGAVSVPINKNCRQSDTRHLVQHAGVKIIVADARRAEVARKAASGLDGAPGVVELQLASLDLLCGQRQTISVGPSFSTTTPETLANIQYTSGTTGMPKGCMLSQAYWIRIARVVSEALPGLTEDDVLLTAQPFSYMDPQWNVAASLVCGARLVVLDGFHPSTFWRSVATHGATVFYCLGAMPTLMLAVEPSDDEKSHRVRQILCSGIPANRHQELEDRFGAPWCEVYGTTETGVDATAFGHRDLETSYSGFGRALTDREIKIINENGEAVPPNTVGEMLIRGPRMMDGYFRDPDATQRSFVDGWYRTGDQVAMDTSGALYFAGRTKDMIRRGGENISAVEVEATLERHPKVARAACIPVDDELRGEEVKAFLLPREPGSLGPLDVQEIAEYAQQELAAFKVPRFWQLTDELPITPSERVAKHQLSRERCGVDLKAPIR